MAASRNHNERDGAKEDLKKMTQQVGESNQQLFLYTKKECALYIFLKTG